MRRIALLVAVIMSACGIHNPVRNTITIEPDGDRRHVTVTAVTQITEEPNDAGARQRVEELRTAILEGRDLLTTRFATVSADSERLSYEKAAGHLRRAEHSVKIAVDDLQRLLSDCGTVQMTDGDRWAELAIYPSASARASRQQYERVQRSLHTWSSDAVRYLRALDRLYSYLDREPHRARAAFTLLMYDNEDEKSTIEEEDALITAVKNAINTIFDHLDETKGQSVTLDEEFDLVYNPFPAEIVVRTPAPITGIEGFEKRDDRTAAIPRAGLIDALISLDGRWASPDPLAMSARASETNSEDPKPETLASMPRRSSGSVTQKEVEDALTARLKPAAAYRVRW